MPGFTFTFFTRMLRISEFRKKHSRHSSIREIRVSNVLHHLAPEIVFFAGHKRRINRDAIHNPLEAFLERGGQACGRIRESDELLQHLVGDQHRHLVPFAFGGVGTQLLGDRVPAVMRHHAPIGGRRCVERELHACIIGFNFVGRYKGAQRDRDIRAFASRFGVALFNRWDQHFAKITRRVKGMRVEALANFASQTC